MTSNNDNATPVDPIALNLDYARQQYNLAFSANGDNSPALAIHHLVSGLGAVVSVLEAMREEQQLDRAQLEAIRTIFELGEDDGR